LRMVAKMETDEQTFLKENPDAIRLPELDSLTTRAYMTERYLLLFAKSDGHLAWKFDKQTRKVLYECECIKRAKRLIRFILNL